MPDFPLPATGILLAHFIVVNDIERSRRFYTDVLGGETVRAGQPAYVSLANSWIIINVGGAPTDDKPTVTLEPPRDLDRASSFLNVRVADVHAVYAEWRGRGAEFLTPPIQRETEIRCATPMVTSSRWGRRHDHPNERRALDAARGHRAVRRGRGAAHAPQPIAQEAQSTWPPRGLSA